MPTKHLFHLLGYYSLFFLATVYANLPINGFSLLLATLFLVGPIVPLWQTHLITDQYNRRLFHLQARIIYSVIYTTTMLMFSMVDEDRSKSPSEVISIAVLPFLYSWLFTFLMLKLNFDFLSNKRNYFIHRLKWFTIPGLIVCFAILVMHFNWFNENSDKEIAWNELESLDFDDFNRHPKYFSEYAAQIDSKIAAYFTSSGELREISAVFIAGNSWVKPWDSESYPLLKHELYHFHITEICARLARKEAYAQIKAGYGKEAVMSVLEENRDLERRMQYLYDLESNHSLIEDKQSEWEYIIDSALIDLDVYWTSDIFKPSRKQYKRRKYYRNLYIDDALEINGGNELMPHEERYTNHYRFDYTKNMELARVTYYSGGRIAKDPLFNAARLDIKRINDKQVKWSFFDGKGKAIQLKSGYHSRIFEKRGNVMNSRYFDAKGNSIALNDGVFRRHYRLDDVGRVRSLKYFNQSGTQMKNKEGVEEVRFNYLNDSIKLAFELLNFSSLGKAIEDIYGIYSRTYIYDNEGNLRLNSFLDKEGQAAYHNGFHVRVNVHDELGRIRNTQYWDEDEMLVENEKGIAKYSYSDDRYGNISRYASYNHNDVLKAEEEGVAQYYFKYDIKKNRLMNAVYDTGSRLLYDEDGYGKVVYTYDSLNRKTSVCNLDAYNYYLPRPSIGGMEEITYEDAADGSKTVHCQYLKRNGEADTNLRGVASIVEEYDTSNNLLEMRVFNLNGELHASQHQTAIYRYVYDENGNKTKASFYTPQDEPANARGNVFINNYKYDAEGTMLERSYLDTAEQLIAFGGPARIVWKEDNKGNILEERLYNEQNQLMDSIVAISKFWYNDKSEVIEEKDFNQMNELTDWRKFERDENGKVIKTSFYFEDATKKEDGLGVHSYHYVYEKKKLVREEHRNKDLELTEIKGIAQYKTIRDERGLVIKEFSYDKNKRLAIPSDQDHAKKEYAYDDYDRIVSTYFYGSDEKALSGEGEISEIRFVYDKSGNILFKANFSTYSKLCIDEEGVAIYSYQYNRHNDISNSETFNLEEAEKIESDIEWLYSGSPYYD